MHRYFFILLTCLFFGSVTGARAQRTMNEQSFATVSYVNGIYPVGAIAVHGFEAGYGMYLIDSYWEAGVRVNPLFRLVTVGSASAYGGFMYRLAATRSRMLNFYGGGRFFIGVDYTIGSNPFDDLIIGGESSSSSQVSVIDTTEAATKLMLGVEPRLELEFFFLKKLAFVLSASLPVKFMTQQDVASGRASAGLRLNF